MSYSVLRPHPIPRRPVLVPTVVTRGRSGGTQGTLARTLVLFWFVVGMFVGVAVMKTAVNQSPAAQHVAQQIRALVR